LGIWTRIADAGGQWQQKLVEMAGNGGSELTGFTFTEYEYDYEETRKMLEAKESLQNDVFNFY
jgi:hypothetical protein